MISYLVWKFTKALKKKENTKTCPNYMDCPDRTMKLSFVKGREDAWFQTGHFVHEDDYSLLCKILT